MKKRRFLAALLCYAMVFTSAVPSSVAAADAVIADESVYTAEDTALSDEPALAGEDELTTDSLAGEGLLEALDEDALAVDELTDEDDEVLENVGTADSLSGNDMDDEETGEEINRDMAEASSCFKVLSNGNLDLIDGYTTLADFKNDRVVIPKDTKHIPALTKLFKNNATVKIVQFESGATVSECTIEQGAFSGSNIIEFYAPENYKKIDESTFANCSALTHFEFFNVEEIGDGAFSGCRNLGSDLSQFIGNNKVKSIGDFAFSNTGFTSLGISALVLEEKDTVTIGDYAFSGCYSLKSATLPKSVKTISYGCFDGCSALERVTINGGGTIAQDAFKDCKKLAAIDLGRVTGIDQNAFLNCINLVSLVFPETIDGSTPAKVIKTGAFAGCTGIKNLRFDYNGDEKNVILAEEDAFPMASGVTVKGYIQKLKDYVDKVNETAGKNWKFISILTKCTIKISERVAEKCGVVVKAGGKEQAFTNTKTSMEVMPGTTVTLIISQVKADFGIIGDSLNDGSDDTKFTFVSYSKYQYVYKCTMPDHDMVFDFRTYSSKALNNSYIKYRIQGDNAMTQFVPYATKDISIDNGAGKKGQLVIASTYEGETYNLCEGLFNYTSSDTGVAKISNTGVVTVLKAGKTKITATCKDNSKVSVSFTLYSNGESAIDPDSMEIVVDGDDPKYTVKTIRIDEKDVSANVVKLEKSELSSQEKKFNIKLNVKNEDSQPIYVNAEWKSGDTGIAKVSSSKNMTNSNTVTVLLKATGETYVSASVKSGKNTYTAYFIIRVVDNTPRVVENTVNIKLSHSAYDWLGGTEITIVPVNDFNIPEDKAKLTSDGGWIFPEIYQLDTNRGEYEDREGFKLYYTNKNGVGQYTYRLIPTGNGLVQGIGSGKTKEFTGKNTLYVRCINPDPNKLSDYYIPINKVRVTNSPLKYNLKTTGKINLRYTAKCYNDEEYVKKQFENEEELPKKDKYEKFEDYWERYVNATVGYVKFPNPIGSSEARLWKAYLVSDDHYAEIQKKGRWVDYTEYPNDRLYKNFNIRVDYTEDAVYITRSNTPLEKENDKPVVKGKILYYFEGIHKVGDDDKFLVKDITIPTTTKAPNFYLSSKSSVDSTENVGQEFKFKLINKATKKVAVTSVTKGSIELDKSKDYTRFDKTIDIDGDGVITLKTSGALPQGKSVAVINVKRDNWEMPAQYTYTVNAKSNTPTVKVSPSTLTLNSRKSGADEDEGEIKITLNQLNTEIAYDSPTYAGKGLEPAGLAITTEPGETKNTVKVVAHAANGVAKGSYKYKMAIRYKNSGSPARDLKYVTFTVKVSNTQPSLNLKTKTFTFNYGSSDYKEKEIYKSYVTVKGMSVKRKDKETESDRLNIDDMEVRIAKYKKNQEGEQEKVRAALQNGIEAKYDTDKKQVYLEIKVTDISDVRVRSFSYTYELVGIKMCGTVLKPVKITVKGTINGPTVTYSSKGKLNQIDPKSYVQYKIKIKNFANPALSTNVAVYEYDPGSGTMKISPHFRAERDEKNQLITRLYPAKDWKTESEGNHHDDVNSYENKNYSIYLQYELEDGSVQFRTKTFNLKPAQSNPKIKLTPGTLQFVSTFDHKEADQRADVTLTKTSVLYSQVTAAKINDSNQSILKNAFEIEFNKVDDRNYIRKNDKTCDTGYITVTCKQPELLKKGKTYKLKVDLETDWQYWAEVKQKDSSYKWQRVKGRTIQIPVVVNK